jgi:hypothetical protein
MSLLSSKFLLGMGQVMEFGQRKYDQNNWRKGIEVSRLLDAANRHLLKWTEGDEQDEESGQDHLFHAAVDLMMAWETARNRPSFDDRFMERAGMEAKLSTLQPPPSQLGLHLTRGQYSPKTSDVHTISEEQIAQKLARLEQLCQGPYSAQSESVTVLPKS